MHLSVLHKICVDGWTETLEDIYTKTEVWNTDNQVNFIYIAIITNLLQRALQSVQQSVLRPSIRMRKNSSQKPFNREKMEETSGRLTEEESLSQDRPE